MHGPTADALNCRIEDLRSSGIIREMYVALWEQGKVPYIGIFATRPNLETYIVGVFDCFQIPYSALERQHEELIQAAVDSGAGVIVRGAVARGEPGASLGKERRWAWEAAGLDDLLEQGEARTGFRLRRLLSRRPISSETRFG